MTSEEIVVVAGAGRCGTSLVMQMLRAGGLPIWPGSDPVSGEDALFHARFESDPAVIEEARGFAVKLLAPILSPGCFPGVPNVMWLWCRRDHHQQALSMIKWTRALLGVAIDADAGTIAKYERSIAQDESALLDKIYETPLHTIREISWERLVLNPGRVAAEICGFVDRELNTDAMVSCVIPRTPDSYPGLLEVSLVRD